MDSPGDTSQPAKAEKKLRAIAHICPYMIMWFVYAYNLDCVFTLLFRRASAISMAKASDTILALLSIVQRTTLKQTHSLLYYLVSQKRTIDSSNPFPSNHWITYIVSIRLAAPPKKEEHIIVDYMPHVHSPLAPFFLGTFNLSGSWWATCWTKHGDRISNHPCWRSVWK